MTASHPASNPWEWAGGRLGGGRSPSKAVFPGEFREDCQENSHSQPSHSAAGNSKDLLGRMVRSKTEPDEANVGMPERGLVVRERKRKRSFPEERGLEKTEKKEEKAIIGGRSRSSSKSGIGFYRWPGDGF